MAMIANDVPPVVNTLQDIQSKVNEVTESIKAVTKKVEDGDIVTAKGISFLEVKYHLLLSYLINLTHLMLQKSTGNQIEGLVDIERLVEIRTVLEKMRPIDRKLKYQIDKVIKTAVTGALDNDNPLRFKANPENMVSKFGEEENESGSDDDEGTSKSKKYVPPKLASVYYDGDVTQKDRDEMRLAKAQKKALSASIMEDLRNEYHHGPEEVANSAIVHSRKRKNDMEHQQNYEEDNFIRLSMTKQEKHAQRQSEMSSGIDGITKFGSFGALTMTAADVEGGSGQKKRKRLSKGKGSKKGSKKKRRF
ncbi:neuroguidin-like [Lineus longissimus]|uniref:neuroguidin-like n=1 Tax=Lineus longissimus TaxID=88925 RepID=UPI00315DD1AD